MNKDIVFRLVLKNNPELIIRAAEIEEGLWEPEKLPVAVMLNLYRRDRGDEAAQETGPDNSVPCECNVILADPERINDPLLVRLPNGKTKWTSLNRQTLIG